MNYLVDIDRATAKAYHAADYAIAFVVEGKPIPKGRPIYSRKNGMRTPDKTVAYERLIGQHAQFAHGASGYGRVARGPVAVRLHFILPRPDRLCRKKDPDGLMLAPVRPDVDNLAKAVLDGMKRIWVDDAQVCWKLATKEYAEKATPKAARTVVWVWSL